MAATRRLYRQTGGGTKAEFLAVMGLPGDMASSFEDTEEEALWIYPANWKTVQLFSACGTQWRVGMGGAFGLDYASVAVVARAMGIRITAARMSGLQAMEAEALKIMGERRHER